LVFEVKLRLAIIFSYKDQSFLIGRNMTKIFFNKRTLIGLLILVAILFGFWISIQFMSNVPPPQSGYIISSFPNNPTTDFALPPLGQDQNERISESLKKFGIVRDDFKEQNPKTFYDFKFLGFAPAPEMRSVETSGISSFWLNESQPYRSKVLIAMDLPKGFDEDDIIVVGLLDGREMKMSANNSILQSHLKFQIKRGDYLLFDLTTEPIPLGAHILSFLVFSQVSKIDPTYADGVNGTLPRAFSASITRGYVGNTKPTDTIKFNDWSTAKSFSSNFDNAFNINANNVSFNAGVPIWRPEPVLPNQKIDYLVWLNNPGDADREYCLIGFFDYQIIPIQNNANLTCGIVKAGRMAKIPTSFTAPAQEGDYRLQLIRFENPLQKLSYQTKYPASNPSLQPSDRILIKVRATNT
jgi:hypothetical protein